MNESRDMNECCKVKENLALKDGVYVCKVCGKRHFGMKLEPVRITIKKELKLRLDKE